MNEPRIVSPGEAQGALRDFAGSPSTFLARLANTVATEPARIAVAIDQGYEAGLEDGDIFASRGEPDRIRAAVVEALLPIKRYAEAQAITEHALGHEADRRWLDILRLIERVENGADL